MRSLGPALALVAGLIIACKKHDAATGPVAPLPGDGSASGSATPPGDPTPPPSNISDADLDKLMRDVMAYLGVLAGAVDAAGTDCPKMAAAIEKVTNEHTELISRAHTLDGDPSAEDRAEQWMKTNEAGIRPTFEKLFAGLKRCQSDAAVQAAMEKAGT